MRGIIRKLALWIFGTLLVAIFVGVISEFFIELAREHGLYDNPSKKVDAVVGAFAGFVTNWWFISLTLFVAGLALGLWIDTLLRQREGAKEPATDLSEASGIDYAAWDNIYDFSLFAAACLWAGISPPIGTFAMPQRVWPYYEMLSQAIKRGEIDLIERNSVGTALRRVRNPQPGTPISRDLLIKYAAKIAKRPEFLFPEERRR